MIEFIPSIKDNIVSYSSRENGEETGSVKCEIDGWQCRISSLSADKPDTAEGLIRSALSAAGSRNVYIAEFCTDCYENVALQLGFSRENGKLIGEIPLLLSGKCGSCHK